MAQMLHLKPAKKHNRTSSKQTQDQGSNFNNQEPLTYTVNVY